MNVKLWMKGRFLYYVASILLALAYLLLWFLDNPAGIEELRYGGWIIFAVGLVLIFLPMFVFRSKGKVSLSLISRQEDQQLVEKFGDGYKRYTQNVPGMNLLVGIIRLVQHWKRE